MVINILKTKEIVFRRPNPRPQCASIYSRSVRFNRLHLLSY